MLQNFRAETYSKLRYLAQKDGKSVSAYVATRCDNYFEKHVSTTYTVKEEKPKDE